MRNLKFQLSALAIASLAPTVFAQETDFRAEPEKAFPMLIEAAKNMRVAIDDNAPVIKELQLKSGKLEDLAIDEQFIAFAEAINSVPETPDQKRLAIERVFGPQNSEIVDYVLADKGKTDYVAQQLSAADNYFLKYKKEKDETAWGIVLNPDVGTLGVGINAAWEINKYFSIRGRYGSGSLSGSKSVSKADLDFGWENKNNAALLLDWHPGGTQFHFTIGVMHSKPKVDFKGNYTAEKNVTVKYQGVSYTEGYKIDSNYVIDGEWKNDYQPYLGFGWSTDGYRDRGFFISFEMGLMYMGKSTYEECGNYSISDTTSGNTIYSWDRTNGGKFASDDDRERYGDSIKIVQEIDDDIRDAVDDIADFLHKCHVYPVIQLGAGFRF